MSRDIAKAIARIGADRARDAVRAALIDEHEAPAPQVLLRGDVWTGVTTAIDADGWRAVLVLAGGRRTSSRTCTVVDPEGATAAVFPADVAATRALAIAAGCLAPRLLRTGEPVRLGLFGAGALGRAVRAELEAVLDVEQVAVFDPDEGGDAAATARGATLVVTATNARDPVLRADWVEPGCSVLALGADRRGRRELDYRLLADAAFVTCDAAGVARVIADDLRDCVADGHLDWQEVTPVADVLSGQADARVGDDDLVVAKLIDATPLVLALARLAL